MGGQPRSLFVDVDGPVHVADYGAASGDDASIVVCVHGLSGSYVSWRRVAAALYPRARVLALDLPGHGRSPLAGRSAAVSANQAVLGRVLRHLDPGPVSLVGHSMGATLSVLHAAAAPDTVRSLALLAPPMPRVRGELPTAAMAGRVALCAWPWLARRTLSRRLSRQGAEAFVERGLNLSCASTDAIDPVTRRLITELVARRTSRDAEAVFVEAARSMGLMVARSTAYRDALTRATAAGLVVHGAQDRLLASTSLKQLAHLQPAWKTHVLQGVGHSPHLEAPELIARLIERSLPDARHAAESCSVPLPPG